MTNPPNRGTPSGGLVMSPFDHVRAQLARQKWAVDTHNEGVLYNIYARDCVLLLKQDGLKELGRLAGRAEVIAMMVKGWNQDHAWRPGSMIHVIGTSLLETAPEGMIRSWCYATYVHLSETGATEMRGYGKYYDLWAEEDHIWRLREREVHIFGLQLHKLAPTTE